MWTFFKHNTCKAIPGNPQRLFWKVWTEAAAYLAAAAAAAYFAAKAMLQDMMLSR